MMEFQKVMAEELEVVDTRQAEEDVRPPSGCPSARTDTAPVLSTRIESCCLCWGAG